MDNKGDNQAKQNCERRTDRSHALYDEGRALIEVGDLEQAVERLKQSVEVGPHFKTLELLGECLLSSRPLRSAAAEPKTLDHMNQPFQNVTRPPEGQPSYRCPCCSCLTLLGRGGYEICPICFREDYGQDSHDADEVRGGPNGSLSLAEARRNYQEFGASQRRLLPNVRLPKPEER